MCGSAVGAAPRSAAGVSAPSGPLCCRGLGWPPNTHHSRPAPVSRPATLAPGSRQSSSRCIGRRSAAPATNPRLESTGHAAAWSRHSADGESFFGSPDRLSAYAPRQGPEGPLLGSSGWVEESVLGFDCHGHVLRGCPRRSFLVRRHPHPSLRESACLLRQSVRPAGT